ncbi:anamorsin homolog [Solanum lycopersicum]|uniref:Anamorsin homolog n=1 Tax=Solanum lycopersicum TaxID=4081 RepID=A0A3Q7HT97_SOLLC|nr:anamorsin homolog [Solanum lycopersicum]
MAVTGGQDGDGSILVLVEDVMVPVSVVYNAINILKKEGVEKLDPMIVTQASAQSLTPVETASMDVVALICRSLEFPSDKLCGDISRVLKPGGTVLLSLSSQSVSKEKSTHDRKLLLAGFSDTQSFEAGHSIVITAKKPSWKVGSSFSIKKVAKSLPKVQIDDDSDLIDEDSLLTEEDLKKPQLPSVDDCEVGKTKKACKNCTCGRAEAETKVQLGPTAEQLNNPQSACGSCGLGDAFRCGTCPYKGLPPFKLGEKVTLSASFLDADI